MMSEDKIAKMIVRIAEDNTTATRDNVRYERWSGVIDYNGTKGAVKEATFALVNGGISWEEGTWLSGTWNGGTWNSGIWEDGTWNKGIWSYGIWKDGTWKKGTWKIGSWYDGTWENGVWEYGF